MTFSLYWAPRAGVFPLGECCPLAHTPFSFQEQAGGDLVPVTDGIAWFEYAGAKVGGVPVVLSSDKANVRNPPIASTIEDFAGGGNTGVLGVSMVTVSHANAKQLPVVRLELDFTNADDGDLYWVSLAQQPCGCCSGFNVSMPLA